MKVVFMGTPQAAVPTLQRILEDGHEVVAVWTQPDRPSGRGRKLKAPPVKDFALEKGITVHQPTKIRTKKSIALFKSHKADVAVVVAYGRILSKSYLNAFPMGCINVHFSLLPKYRGAAPVNWAIVNGENKTGITTMKMDLGLDTGDMLLQSETEIAKTENAIELMDRLSNQGADLLAETLNRYEEIEPMAQDHEKATLAPLMTKEDGLIDWERNANEISKRIRGFQPFPRSYTSFRGQKLTIWSAAVSAEEFDVLGNGKVLKVSPEEIVVNCGNKTKLQISELQIEGRRRMNTRDFVNGIELQVGDVFGA